jgi:uncharacterized phiE125 gp8 family phage protein
MYPSFNEIRRQLRRTQEPTAIPVQLAEIRRHLRLGDSTDHDLLLTRYIGAAVRRVEQDTQRALSPQTWRLTLDWFPREIELRICPVISVTGITYTDKDGDESTVDPDLYEVDTTMEPGVIRLVSGACWPHVGGKVNNVRVTFTAGYQSATDNDLVVLAIAHAVEAQFYGCDNDHAYSRSIADLSWGGSVYA